MELRGGKGQCMEGHGSLTRPLANTQPCSRAGWLVRGTEPVLGLSSRRGSVGDPDLLQLQDEVVDEGLDLLSAG